MEGVTVYLVDDDSEFRESTTWLLNTVNIATFDYHCATAFLEDIAATPPLPGKACIISDLRMPDVSGLGLIEELKKHKVKLPLIMVSGHADIPLVVKAMRSGVNNFLEKPFTQEQLLESIKSAIHEPMPGFRDIYASLQKLEKLSPREKQVLELVCQGKLNKTIADILGISIKTVELHRANMVNKLNVKNVQDLVRLTLGYQY